MRAEELQFIFLQGAKLAVCLLSIDHDRLRRARKQTLRFFARKYVQAMVLECRSFSFIAKVTTIIEEAPHKETIRFLYWKP